MKPDIVLRRFPFNATIAFTSSIVEMDGVCDCNDFVEAQTHIGKAINKVYKTRLEKDSDATVDILTDEVTEVQVKKLDEYNPEKVNGLVCFLHSVEASRKEHKRVLDLLPVYEG